MDFEYTVYLNKENNIRISRDGDKYSDINLQLDIPDGEYMVDLYYDIISYSPYKDAPSPKNDWLMATPPEPWECDYEIIGGKIVDIENDTEYQIADSEVKKIANYYEEEIYEDMLRYARKY